MNATGIDSPASRASRRGRRRPTGSFPPRARAATPPGSPPRPSPGRRTGCRPRPRARRPPRSPSAGRRRRPRARRSRTGTKALPPSAADARERVGERLRHGGVPGMLGEPGAHRLQVLVAAARQADGDAGPRRERPLQQPPDDVGGLQRRQDALGARERQEPRDRLLRRWPTCTRPGRCPAATSARARRPDSRARRRSNGSAPPGRARPGAGTCALRAGRRDGRPTASGSGGRPLPRRPPRR